MDAPPEFLEGMQARKEGKPKSANPYDTLIDWLGMGYLWASGWEAEDEQQAEKDLQRHLEFEASVEMERG